MKQRYLEVTFRNGKPFAAYLYLPRPRDAKVSKTIEVGHGLLVDVDAAGVALGIEIISPSQVTYRDMNATLARFGVPRVKPSEWAPLAA